MESSTIQQTFVAALRHHQAGQLQEAERLYRQVLAWQPEHVGALNYLGVIADAVGKRDIAVELIRRAISIHPNYADAHGSLGVALHGKGQIDEAIVAFRRAIVLRPDFIEAHNNLGNALQDKRQLDEAIVAYRRAIALSPMQAEPHHNLGNALRAKREFGEAIAAYRRALALKPDYADACSNLGIALMATGEMDEGIAAFRRAIELNPKFADAYNNLGNALGEKGQLDEAEAAYRQAIALRPNYADAHSNLGSNLKDQGRLDEAIAACRQAIAINPRLALAHSNLILTLHYHPGYDGRSIAEELGRWNQQHAEPLRKFIQPHQNQRDPERRLRIGYLSPDFRDHPVGRCLLPLIRAHDRRLFEIVCYAHVLRPDDATRQFQDSADLWRDGVGLSDEQVAAQIRQDRIDILVDLSLHTAGNRLPVFARKPAPIQVSYLGYPGTTGMAAIDYRLSDSSIDPPESSDQYTETTLRLPRSYLCWEWSGKDVPVGPLPARSNGFVTFGCLNNFCKATPDVLRTWGDLMSALPTSRLILRSPSGSTSQRVLEILGQCGINADRVELIARVPWDEYVGLYHRMDITLDPFPYCGHTVSLDSLWMGVPVVTLSGEKAVGRGGRSLLSNLGLAELIAFTPGQYVKIALDLAGDLDRMESLRQGMRARMQASPLMDAPGLARDLESAYRQVWRAWCEKSLANA
ncbi:MAG: tetratricopeptide repeat protein [Tepidisphaeraceae bacterium]